MCNFALVGATAESAKLREILESADAALDTHVLPDAEMLRRFPVRDAVVCVTLNGCSCALLEGLGQAGRLNVDAHVAGPGYGFRRALAAAALRFGGVRLVTYSTSCTRVLADELPRRSTTLSAFLRFGLQSDDGLVCIRA